MEKYHSQVKQDQFLHKSIFKNLKNGIFLDLGAFDGKTFSNTYFFEKNLEWTGFCFEPIPLYYKKLRRNRKCNCYNNCIGDKEETVEFSFVKDNPMLSGISKNIHEEDLIRISKNKNKPILIRSKVISIKDFIQKNKISEIHLLSLDIEGNEEKVLKALDFERTFIHAICLEDNYNEKKLDTLLKKKGFVLIKHCGFDKIFINRKSKFLPPNYIILMMRAELINKVYSPRLQKFFRNNLNNFPNTKKLIKRILKV